MTTDADAEAEDHTDTGERTCQDWRCNNSCFGLPGCRHPERTPFYLMKIPEWMLRPRTSHVLPFAVAVDLCLAVILVTLWVTP